MESAIGRQWYQLYENNPKLQAFAVLKGSEVVWQTENWNLVEDVQSILKAQKTGSSKVSASGVKYKTIESDEDSLIATADKDQGHLLLARIDKDAWTIAWAESGSVPELALIDLMRTAIVLKGNV